MARGKNEGTEKSWRARRRAGHADELEELLPKGRQSDGARALHLGGKREHGFLALGTADDLKADGKPVSQSARNRRDW